MLDRGRTLQDRYVIEELIGQGGTGSMYVAYDNRLRRKCAVKEALRSSDPTLQKVFTREAVLLANLQHRALPQAIDHFQEFGTWYVVMQLIPGEDLAAQLKRNKRPFPAAKVLDWADDLLDALVQVHSEGILHRDIKPGNLKVSPSGQIFLLDFGFARGSLKEVSQLPSSVMGHTPAYAAPEQINGLEPDPRDDLYSLAASLYHLLLCDLLKEPLPFMASVRATALADGEADPLRSAHDLNSQVPLEMATVLSQAMSRTRSQRPSSARAMREALRKVRQLQHSIRADKGTTTEFDSQLETTELYYQFETVIINGEGNITERRKGEARYFIDELGEGATIEMVSIPSGAFVMGSPEWRPKWADRSGPIGCIGPQHRVAVPAFYFGKYQVTQAQWRAVASQKMINCELPLHPSKFPFAPMDFEGNELPVEGILWQQAVEFCARLSSFTGHDYRLPSESEWEYACRAGTTTPFAFGQTISAEVANFEGKLFDQRMISAYTYGSTIPVGSLGLANAFGLYDMHGNVWEWCADTDHHTYHGAPSDGSAWDDGDPRYRVMRGGCWDSSLNQCASAYHFRSLTPFESRGIGFRIAMTVPC